MFKLYETELS